MSVQSKAVSKANRAKVWEYYSQGYSFRQTAKATNLKEDYVLKCYCDFNNAIQPNTLPYFRDDYTPIENKELIEAFKSKQVVVDYCLITNSDSVKQAEKRGLYGCNSDNINQ